MFGAGFRVHGSCGPWPRTPDREPRTEPRTKHPEPRTPPHRNEKRILFSSGCGGRHAVMTACLYRLDARDAFAPGDGETARDGGRGVSRTRGRKNAAARGFAVSAA